MRLKLIRSLPWLLVFLPAFVRPAPQKPRPGEIRVNPQTKGARLPAGLRILVRHAGIYSDSAAPDAGGRFHLLLPDPPDTTTDLFALAPGMDTLYLHTVSSIDSGALHLLFPCRTDSTAGGAILCPKCRREDQVYPMQYGDPIVITRHRDTAGKTSYERRPDTKQKPDTLLQVARYWCRRDKIMF